MLRNDWNKFESYIATLPEVTDLLKQVGNVHEDVVVAIDCSNSVIKQLLYDNLDLRPLYFDTSQNPKYEYDEKSNSFRVDMSVSNSDKRTRQNIRVKVKICGGKPDDITVILAVVTSKPLPQQ
mmetsp:Transcript_14101/g.19257  ORF Transcript_14101/g.19257 Transcript_14101/m.19257 type:complete len:123 (-) Transcript_14101:100-468(-)